MPLDHRLRPAASTSRRSRIGLVAVLGVLTLAACGSDQPERRNAAAPTPAATDAPIRNPTPQQAERLRVALATNIDPALARRYERVAPLVVEGCRLMRRDPGGATWDATVLDGLRAAGFDGLSLRDASLFLEILRSEVCPIAG